jgi:propionyl-CoA carboxylase alpha chain
MVTGLDLVRLQIEIADGARLDVNPRISGHAIEARLYAEDPLNDFLPVTGTFHRFAFPERRGLRVESGIEDGSEVSVFYDPLLAKVIAHAPTREEAAGVLAAALREAAIHGSITNRALLVRILEHPEFLAGAIDTHFLQRHDPAALSAPLADADTEWRAAVSAALSDQAFDRSRAGVLASIPAGWRNRPGPTQHRAYQGAHGTHDIEYSAVDGFRVGGLADLDVSTCTPDLVEWSAGGITTRFAVARYGDVRHLDSAEAPVHLVAVPRFPTAEVGDAPGSLLAPMPGKVIRVEVGPGDEVTAGQVMIVLEAMKMEHTLRAPHAGTVIEVDCSPGEQVEANAVLVVVTQGQASST